jgi:TetR/AcrR family transcriptional repressor of nem operon
MKVSREQAERNRARVVEVAGAQFRAHGLDGIGIADLMRQAGLTHGGFYANFASKDDLAAEAVAHVFADTGAALMALAAESADPLAAIVRFYLSPAHRDNVAEGCVLAALGPEGARGSPGVRAAFEAGIRGYLALLEKLDPSPEARQRAMVTLSTMLGALVLSRTVTDPKLSAGILESAVRAIVTPPS